MRITAVAVRDFKRIKDIKIVPAADRALILVGGKNAQGKSSLLDALTSAIGGKKSSPSDPVRHGADEATITVELDGGALTVHRVIQPDGESTLEVRDNLGPIKAPQERLNALIGARFLDPLHFLGMPAKDQRAQLMKMIPDAARITELDGKRERAFTKRTEVGRDLEKAKGELARIGTAPKVDTAIDVAALNAEKAQLSAQQRAGYEVSSAHDAAQRAHEATVAALNATRTQISDLEARLATLRESESNLGARAAVHHTAWIEAKAKLDETAAAWAKAAPRGAEIDAELAKADAHNRAVYEAEALAKRRQETAKTVDDLTAERENITKAIVAIDDRKAQVLEAAKLPVEGLSVNDEGVTLGGVPFAQASGAERLRVALTLAIAASPGLADVWIRDGALLDEEHLELVRAQADAAGCTVWVERVGTADAGAIIISDGQVVP